MRRRIRSMVRVAAASTALAMAAGGLAACSSSSGKSGGSTADGSRSAAAQLTVWHYWDGKNADTFAAMVKQYEAANPGTKITVVNVPGSDIMTKLQAALSSHTTPDVAIGDLVNVPKLVASGQLTDLKGLVPANTLSDIYPSMLTFGTQGGKQFSVPVSANDLALMYNKTLFAKAGLDPANPPKTWDDMKSAAAKITAKTGKPGFELFTQAGDNGEGLTWNFQVSLWQAGGKFLSDDNSKAAFNTPEGKKALQYWVDLIDAKASPLGPWGAFEKNNAASAQEGSWMVGIWAANPPFDFGTAVIPSPADGRAATNLGGEQAVVFKSDDAKQKAAAQFLTWFDAPAQNLMWSEQTGFLPVRKAVADSAEYKAYVTKESPATQPFLDALPSAHARPNTPKYADASLAFAKQIEQALYGKKSVDQALSDAERDVNTALASS